MSRRFPILLLLIAACTVTPSATTTETTVTTDAAPTTTTSEPTTVPEGVDDLDETTRGQLIELIDETERLRGHEFLRPPRVAVVDEAELERRVREDFLENPEEIATDEALYVLLGLLPPGTDLLGLLSDLFGEQVAGFYDGSTGELVVAATTGGFSAYQRTTVVHELTHALTDQVHGVWPEFEGLIDAQAYDQATAMRALLEGDATLTQALYMRERTPEELREIVEEIGSVDTSVYDSAPRFIRESLAFPYDAGTRWVQGLYESGGFAAVDAAYDDPPISTEQVMHPDRWPDHLPAEVDHPRLDVPGYELIYDSVWGELGFSLMFGQVLGDRSEAVDGWGGDRYQVWFDGRNVALALTFRGDRPEDAQELYAGLAEFIAAAMPQADVTVDDGSITQVGDDFVWVGMLGPDQVGWVAASDPAVGRGLAEGYPRGLP
ncbi:MAG: hypothetical protein KatS3mg011_0749 [Acidimicrobiia bacterium]|nr:MAG: hypothetical protein KatS3mg011_0749 [Acidimicrobiia bacterium]